MNHNGTKAPKPRRNTGGGRGGRMRPTVNMDKCALSEGVYSNPRMTHAATVVIGCVVQVQVRNGKTYEGIFKTFSPQMDIVLEKAHLVTEGSNNSIPSADELIEKPLIFNLRDVVMMTAQNVDLDFASRDAFTDTSISKFNGQVQEKELQPWVSDDPINDGPIDDLDTPTHRSTNGTGWDPIEMFKLNKDKFNVGSNFDPSLSQYTTPLKQENTDEYKEREAFAAKMAEEIENSDAYKSSIALENGDRDEESAFSSVVRASEKTDGRYVPPHQRRGQGQGRAVRTNSQSSSGGSRSQRDSASPTDKVHTPPATNNRDEPKLNGEQDEYREVEKATVVAAPVSPVEDKPDVDKNILPNNANKDRKPLATAKPRDIQDQIEELRKFSTDFKLSGENQERKPRGNSNAPAGQGSRVEAPIQPASNPPAEDKSPTPDKQEHKLPPQQQPSPDDKQREEAKKREETVKKSTLNPNAKEFKLNPNAPAFTPKQQTSTTPRPQTQSPGMPMVYQTAMPGGTFMIPQPHVMQQQQQPRPKKAAVVSVQQREFVNQATGTPLMANTPQPPYMYVTNPHPTSAHVHQMISARMMNPHLHQAHQAASEQQMHSQSGQPQTVFVAPPGAQAVPAHMGGQGGGQGPQHPNQAHVGPHHQPTPPHSQPSHMNPQSQPNGPPTPGPSVQHGPPQHHHSHPGQTHGHPPTSQTPQPHGGHIIYQQQIQQQGHPPLQPSPHTPTSPQTMYPTPISYTSYSFAGQSPMHGIPQMTFSHTQPHTTVTNAPHQQHQHITHQPQFVMMQNPQAVAAAAAAAGQLQHAHQVPHGGHAPHLQGPMAGQAGPAMMPQQFTTQNVPMHYVPHPAMQSQVGGPQVSYPHAS